MGLLRNLGTLRYQLRMNPVYLPGKYSHEVFLLAERGMTCIKSPTNRKLLTFETRMK
jgi:hypothetical protein